ncbi:hypothetical protein [Dyella solisilvae]
MPFWLDTAMQRHSATDLGSGAVLLLTGVYHNPLRPWMESRA